MARKPEKGTRTYSKRAAAPAIAAALGLVLTGVAGALAGPPSAATQASIRTAEPVRPAIAASEYSAAPAAAASSSGEQAVTASVEPSVGIAIAADGTVADASNTPVAITQALQNGAETLVLTPR